MMLPIKQARLQAVNLANMDRWLIRKKDGKTADNVDKQAAETPSTENPSTSTSNEKSSTSNDPGGDCKRKSQSKSERKSKRRKYQEDFIRYGFTCLTINEVHHPQCVLCTEVLAHDSLKPVKLKRHLQTKHSTHVDKPIEFFRRKEAELQGQQQVIHKQTTISMKAQIASYEVSYLIAKCKKPHTIGETLIRPAAVAMCRAMHGDKIASQLEKIPLSDNTVARRIGDIAKDIKSQLIDRVKNSGKYALQLDESTDISNAAQLLAFVRYIYEGKLQEDLLFCSPLEGTCTGKDIFDKLDNFMREEGLCWKNCIGICTDGAGAMLGRKKGLKARVHEVAPQAVFTHCVIHREALASKALDAELSGVLQTAVKIVNFIKARPMNSRLFATLCKEMGSDHESLLLHTEVRWLSRGLVLRRLFELRDELRIFLIDSGSPYAELLTDSKWLANLAYLSEIFERLNALNASLQGANTNILSLSDKIDAFTKKLERWAMRVEGGSVEMFPELEEFLDGNELSLDTMKETIVTHLRGLRGHFRKYFQEQTYDHFDWIRQPFAASTGNNLPSELQDSLLDLSSDRTLKTTFASTPLDEFWLSVSEEYPGLSEITMDVLIPFASTYLCETTFSALTYLKNKLRSRLRVEDDLRVAVSSIQPRMELLCSESQAHPSH